MAAKTVVQKIVVGCDHAAFEMKNKVVNYVKQKYPSLEVVDVGVYTEDRMDYPDIADTLCKKIQNKEVEAGILLCGTGIGVSIAANKHAGIRAALVHDEYTARMSRMHNNANVLCFGGRTTGEEIAKQLVDTYLTTSFLGEQHAKRLDKIAQLEAQNSC